MSIETFVITRREEFETHIFFSDKPQITYSTEPISNNNFYFSKDLNRIHIKKTNTTHGSSCFYIPNLRLGDIIEVEFEYIIVDPIVTDGIIRISFNEIESNDNTKTPVLKTYCECVHNNNEWGKANATYMVTNDSFSNHLVEVGMPWWKTGEVYIKDIIVNVKRRIPRLENVIKGCMIRKNGETWDIRSDFWGSDIGTLTEVDSTTLKLTFKDTFENRPIGLGGTDTSISSRKYRVCIGALTQINCYIKFVKNDDTFAELSNIEDGVHFSIAFIGSLRL